MATELSREMMIGMLRRGQIGEQILQILDVIAPTPEMTREYVCEQLGIADCPENDGEIVAYMNAWV